MRKPFILLLLSFLAASTGVEASPEGPSTTEIVALGINSYLVFLEISELGDSRPSKLLGGIGMAAGALTLALKSYDGSFFSGLLTTAAAVDIALGLTIVIRADRLKNRRLILRPEFRLTPKGPAAGIALRFG
jgi:hypothetical protein